jgi:hypothetical protein
VGLWVLPFTWPAAAATTAVFLAIAIPLAIIIYFMTEVLHIKTDGIPKLRCFDKKTRIPLKNGVIKDIQNVTTGDILENGDKVTATIKVDSRELRMFCIRDIVISESHIVKHEQKWIPVREHPEAIEIFNYNEPFLYCLNTSSKEITLNGLIFTDWDEIYDDTLEKVLESMQLTKKEDIHKYLNNGLQENMLVDILEDNKMKRKLIKDVKIGDILSLKSKTHEIVYGKVYGIVEIENNEDLILGKENMEKEKLYHLLVTNNYFESNGIKIPDYNYKIDFICKK